MPTYHRETWVDAPLDEVWEFHSRIEGLTEVTPEFMNLRVEAVTGPDGEADPEVLEKGTRIELSVRPFDIGPRQSWTSVVIEREEGDGKAYFRDEMEGGPFASWEHTHRFYAGDGDDEGETLLSDRIEYELPFGELGEFVAQFGDLGFEPMFRARHRKTKQLLEDDEVETEVDESPPETIEIEDSSDDDADEE